MIKIDRNPCPAELIEKKDELTNEFKKEKKSVWGKSYIKKALLEMSNYKCCYCEIKLGEEGKYMHVEHFHHKDKYPDEVVDWKNLLPSCNRCNINKSTHDTKKEPIINPTLDNPKDFLILNNYMFKAKNHIGRVTIDTIGLNDFDQIVMPRFMIGSAVQNKIEDILDKAQDYINSDDKTIRKKNKIVSGIKNLIKEGLPESEYSATVATVILDDINFVKLKEILINLELWDEELKNNEAILKELKFDIK